MITDSLDQAKADGLVLGSLVVAGGLEKLDDDVRTAVMKIIRGIVLATTAIRQTDLESIGMSAEDSRAFKDFRMEVYDLTVNGWLERCAHAGALN